jgi:hypothetical protein
MPQSHKPTEAPLGDQLWRAILQHCDNFQEVKKSFSVWCPRFASVFLDGNLGHSEAMRHSKENYFS